MGWKTDDDSIKVISRETIEDTDPKLYKKRAKEFVNIGNFKEAEKEYDKAIKYSGKQLKYYLSKLSFYFFDSKEFGKFIRLFLFVTLKKASFLYWLVIYLMCLGHEYDSDFINYLSGISLMCGNIDWIIRAFIT